MLVNFQKLTKNQLHCVDLADNCFFLLRQNITLPATVPAKYFSPITVLCSPINSIIAIFCLSKNSIFALHKTVLCRINKIHQKSLKKYCNSERTLLYSDRTKRNFAVNVPEINTKTKEKNEANRQYEEHLNNYHASFENSPICLFKLVVKHQLYHIKWFARHFAINSMNLSELQEEEFADKEKMMKVKLLPMTAGLVVT